MNPTTAASPLLAVWALAACWTAAGVCAQGPATLRPADLAELARRVDAAHQPDGSKAPVESFRSDLELVLYDKRLDQAGQVDLKVQFLLWKRAESNRVRPLMRYEVRGAEQPIVRGRDRNGPWQLVKGKPVDLTAADLKQDLEQCTQHTNLARQLLRFLAPGDVLRALQAPTPVTEKVLAVGRKQVRCLTVSGELDQFPLVQQAGEDAPVRLEVYVEATTGRLLAVDVWPREGAEPDLRRGERILMSDFRPDDGLLVPRHLIYQYRDENGSLQLHSHVKLPKLELRPTLAPEDFDRPNG